QLGQDYPPALEELRKRRDSARQALLVEKKATKSSGGLMGFGTGRSFGSAMEFTAINRTLGENADTLKMYRILKDQGDMSSLMADVFLREIIDELLEEKEYAEIVTAVGDVEAKVEEEILEHKQMVAMMARMKRDEGLDPSEGLKRLVIEKSAKYYEALVG